MQSKAATVDAYLASLDPERRDAIQAVRRVILDNLDKDYAEGMQYGMIGYYVPHSVFPQGYHCDPRQPLPFAALGSQKNHMSLHLMCIYGSETHRAAFEKAWARTGKKLDMGKACVRFRKLDDIPLEVIGDAIKKVPAAAYIKTYLKLLSTPRPASSSPQKAQPSSKAKASKANTTTKTTTSTSPKAKPRTKLNAKAKANSRPNAKPTPKKSAPKPASTRAKSR